MQKHVNLVDLVKSFPFSQSSFRTDSNSNEYLLAKIGFDTAENEPFNFHNFSSLQGFNFHRAVVSRVRTPRSHRAFAPRASQLVGSSILFVYDQSAHQKESVTVKMIDFAKTQQTDSGQRLNHRQAWELGNREEGYLTGLDSLIGVWTKVLGEVNSS